MWNRSSFSVGWPLTLLLTVLTFMAAEFAHAGNSLRVTQAKWSKSSKSLRVSGAYKGQGPLELYDNTGRLLATTMPGTKRGFKFNIVDPWPELICTIRVKASGASLTKPVVGAPSKGCDKVPRCDIVAPAGAVTVQANQDVTFQAKTKLKDRKAGPLKLDWDFAGGSMGEQVPGGNPPLFMRPHGEQATIKFIRDNSRYHVRFMALDGKGRMCEDAIDVTVGNPPMEPPAVSLMAAKSVEESPGRGSGKTSDVVVLPMEQWSMQGQTDARFTPAAIAVTNPVQTNLGAVVYRKGRLPERLSDAEIKLSYAAASNPHDPAGRNSINSTSQNWPLAGDIRRATPMSSALIQKTDLWETTKTQDYSTFAATGIYGRISDPAKGINPDEAYPIDPDGEVLAKAWPNAVPTVADRAQGTRMPGYAEPYVGNQPVEFTAFLGDMANFMARTIPITDIDDSGRVNPYPLLRVTAVDKASNRFLSATDAVLSTGKDVHCRECHAKGQMAANPSTPWSNAAWHYSQPNWDGTFGGAPGWWEDPGTQPSLPEFFESLDQAGNPSQTIADQEYAAVKNIASLHAFYDAVSSLHDQDNGDGPGVLLCSSCHLSRITGWPAGGIDQNPAADYVGRPPSTAGPLLVDDYYNPDYPRAIHKFHGELQVNGAGELARDGNGIPLRWDASKGTNPNSLFPVIAKDGEPLPMEQNCLRCHSGHREPLYRDRMYTAGVTCYQCHGDLLAVGKASPKSHVNPDGLNFRTDWFDEPDCGSCHVGSGNVGRHDPSFFSEGIMKMAFDPTDVSATPRPVELDNPDGSRFAVVPFTNHQFPSTYAGGPSNGGAWKGGGGAIETLRTRLYRDGKDTHGDVPCAACHGGAHAVWPNHDAKANDNVTAQQLQGHTGPIMECKVCHGEGAFQRFGDLDGGRFRMDLSPDSGVLGGPHGMHPVDDPLFWKKSGSNRGGLHASYALIPGKAGEDQCAACHGNDHRGTRLSKTPVDRVFDFRDVKRNGKLKKAVIKVAAGTPIGCTTCHSVKVSCMGSPAGSECGVDSAATTTGSNKPPVFESLPVATGTIGVPSEYSVRATDPDGDTVTYSISRRPDDMKIDPVTGKITTSWPPSLFYFPWESGNTPSKFEFPYVVTAADGKGGYVTRQIDVKLDCPTGLAWGVKGCTQTSVGGVSITSKPDVLGINVDETYLYQIVASDAANLPLTYSLQDAPVGMTVDEEGLVSWLVPTDVSGNFAFKAVASNSQGGSASQPVSVIVCAPPTKWYPEHGHCM